ncbi:MAG: hypothetical protein KF889_18285 [Alphaproteobacteria bacterium]|nr:hypothetical protein [Alphaproteobacteria bacterium]
MAAKKAASRKRTFVESDDVGRSLAQDRRRKAKIRVKSGQGDRGGRHQGGHSLSPQAGRGSG